MPGKKPRTVRKVDPNNVKKASNKKEHPKTFEKRTQTDSEFYSDLTQLSNDGAL